MSRRGRVQHSHRSIAGAAMLVTVLVSALAWVSPVAAAPGDPLLFTVTSTGDGGDANPGDALCDVGGGGCTLRAAIQEADAQGSPLLNGHTIEFAITGCAAACTITPASPLPTITVPVVIAGYSQPGAQWATTGIEDGLGSDAVLKVELDGSAAGPSNGLTIAAGPSTVQGLVIHGFRGAGVQLSGTGGNGARLEGNFIGTDPSGAIDLGNTNGVHVNGAGAARIGGLEIGMGNVISGNDNFGVVITTSDGNNNKVQGNYIGTDATGTVDLGNFYGVGIFGANNTIGGGQPSAGNVISGNDSGSGSGIAGVFISGSTATSNIVQGNRIGTDVTGTSAVPNLPFGIYVSDSSGNVFGGTNRGEGNTIAFNGNDGIRINGATSVGNTIRGNAIHDNNGKGIENASGGNADLAPPVIGGGGPVTGTACAGCQIDIFSDSVDEGGIYQGSTVADGSGVWAFAGAVTGPKVTATATDGTGNTSEFSAPVAVVALCLPGTFSATGSPPCTPAPAGSYVPSSGATAATPCAAGSFSANPGSASCTPAPAGSFVAGTGATAATPCALGSFVASAGAVACDPAPVDTYVDSTGATAATPCPAGTSTNGATGQTAQTACVPITVDRTLTVSLAGAGSGVVTSNPAGIDCGSDCSEAYPDGSAVDLTPTAGTDSRFVAFGGDADCLDGSVTLGADTACSAAFDLVTRSVGSATGAGSISITTSAGSLSTLTAIAEGTLPTAGKPTGISFPFGFVGWTVTGLAPGQAITVTLTFPAPVAIGSPYWKVIGTSWVDASSLIGSDDGDGILTLTITDGGLGDADGATDGTITDPGAPGVVSVTPPNLRALTVLKLGTGSGTVTSAPAGISCGADCTESYQQGTVVVLSASPAAGSTFNGWSGSSDCTDGSVTMAADRTCKATFKLIPLRALTVTKAGSGTVTSSPVGIACGLDCTESYPNGTVVVLTATPAAGSMFHGWSGHADCTDGTVTMTASKTCKATFKPIPLRTLTVVRLGTGSGTVTSSPAGIACGSDCGEAYGYGTVVTLTATPATGSSFFGWSGDADCTDGTVTMTASKTCKAAFKRAATH